MAFHVPFEHRTRPNDNAVYIGFEEPPRYVRPKPKSNGFGIAGFVLSIFSIISFGLIAPIALIFSLIGLRKSPRGFATAGLIISSCMLVPISLATVGGIMHERSKHERKMVIFEQRRDRGNVELTKKELVKASTLIREYRSDNDGELPGGIDGNKILIKGDSKDAWGTTLRYDLEDSANPLVDIAAIRSAGKDREFDTGDDVVTRIPSGTRASVSK